MALLSVKTTSAWNQLSDKKQIEAVPGSMHQIFIGFWDVVVTLKNGARMGFNRIKWLDKSCILHQREVCDLIGRVSHIDSFFKRMHLEKKEGEFNFMPTNKVSYN